MAAGRWTSSDARRCCHGGRPLLKCPRAWLLLVTNNKPPYLKIHQGPASADAISREVDDRESTLSTMIRAFEQATGWSLLYQPMQMPLHRTMSPVVLGGDGQPVAQLTIVPAIDTGEGFGEHKFSTASIEHVRPLAASIAQLLSENNRLKHTLWQREAELATAIPVSSRPSTEPQLASKMQSVLRSGVEALHCTAAAAYLLDDSTTALKMRSCVGLPETRLMDPARPLRGAVADLEALLGHAVVLEDTDSMPHWQVPEDFGAAVCVPISSSTTPLGTLWMFNERARDFSSEETNLIEIIAGRIAADLEREVLVNAGRDSREQNKQLQQAAQWQTARLPSIKPMSDEFDIAGWTEQCRDLGGDFHDWLVLPDGRLGVTVATAHDSLLTGSLSAAAIQAATKAHAQYPHQPAALLERLGETLWTTSAGDQFASMAYGLIDMDSATLELALAGDAGGLLVGSQAHQLLLPSSPKLGISPDLKLPMIRRPMQRGDLLLLWSSGLQQTWQRHGMEAALEAVLNTVRRQKRETASGLARRVQQLLQSWNLKVQDDRSLVIVRRRM